MLKANCRICFENFEEGKLIKPCNCNNYVHEKCLKKWIQIKNNPKNCEICKSKYNVDFEIIILNQQNYTPDNNEDIDCLLNKKFFLFFLLISSILIILIIYMLLSDYQNNYKHLNNVSIKETSTLHY